MKVFYKGLRRIRTKKTSFVILKAKHDFSVTNLLEGDSRWLVLLRIGINTRKGAALELFAPFCGEDNQTIFSIDVGWFNTLDLFSNVCSMFRHKMHPFPILVLIAHDAFKTGFQAPSVCLDSNVATTRRAMSCWRSRRARSA